MVGSDRGGKLRVHGDFEGLGILPDSVHAFRLGGLFERALVVGYVVFDGVPDVENGGEDETYGGRSMVWCWRARKGVEGSLLYFHGCQTLGKLWETTKESIATAEFLPAL